MAEKKKAEKVEATHVKVEPKAEPTLGRAALVKKAEKVFDCPPWVVRAALAGKEVWTLDEAKTQVKAFTGKKVG